ncbi:hypothetical protein NBRC13296_12745 [Paenibacillus chitinolyticus]|uniref:hypothetical protein n=1 Tax=Paenibacillus chitinolyticus TaxID=79263 RepID=UPI0035579360
MPKLTFTLEVEMEFEDEETVRDILENLGLESVEEANMMEEFEYFDDECKTKITSLKAAINTV